MLELRFIRENIDLVREKCLHRGMKADLIEQFTAIDAKRLALLGEVEHQRQLCRAMHSRGAAPKKKNSGQSGDHFVLGTTDQSQ